MKIAMTAIIKRQRACFMYTKIKIICETFLYAKKPDTFQKSRQFPSRFYIQKSPAWDSGSEQNTLVFHMLGVTGSGPQFRKPEKFRKGKLDVHAHAQ